MNQHPQMTSQAEIDFQPENILLWFRARQTDFLCLFLILFLACSYFVTGILLTDHMIPNSLLQPFPSHRIAAEGRWGHEIIIQLLGGAGNQAVFNTLGMIVLVLNGFLFAEFMNVKARAQRFIVAALVTLSPIFLEYFSFSIDALPYAIGDMAALFGALALARFSVIWPQLIVLMEAPNNLLRPVAAFAARIPPLIAGVIASAGFFAVALGIYQPKISLIAILVAFHLLLEFSTKRFGAMETAQRIAAAAVSVIAAITLYWLSYQLISLISDSQGYNRTFVNSIGDMAGHAFASYGEIFRLAMGFVQSMSLLTTLSLLIGVRFCACRASCVSSWFASGYVFHRAYRFVAGRHAPYLCD